MYQYFIYLCLLVFLLGEQVNTNAQCLSTWEKANAESALSVVAGGIKRSGETGDGQLNIKKKVPIYESGEISFNITDFGLESSLAKEQGYIEAGVEIGEDRYEYYLAPNGILVVSDRGNLSIVNLGETLNTNDDIVLKVRAGKALELVINEVFITDIYFAKQDDAMFFVELHADNAEVTSIFQDYACEETDCQAALELVNESSSALRLLETGDGAKRVSNTGDDIVEVAEVIKEGSNGIFQFRIQEFGTQPDGKKGKIEATTEVGGNTYKYIFSSGTGIIVFQTSVGEEEILKIGSLMEADQYGSVIRLEKEGTNLTLKVNDIFVTTYSGMSTGEVEFSMKITGVQGQLSSAVFDYACEEISPRYTELKEYLDATYYLASNDQVYFQYREEYTKGRLEYQVYDRERNQINTGLVLHNADLPGLLEEKRYGTNRFRLDLTGANLVQGRFYILEVESEKGEILKLRFKT